MFYNRGEVISDQFSILGGILVLRCWLVLFLGSSVLFLGGGSNQQRIGGNTKLICLIRDFSLSLSCFGAQLRGHIVKRCGI